MKPQQSSSWVLVLIGLFKLFKAGLLIILGLTALQLVHDGDIPGTIAGWIHDIHVDPENRYIHTLLSYLPNVSDQQLRELSVGTFVYAGLFLIEGTGLVLRKRWAEYVVIVSTSLFLPLEIYEVVRHIDVMRAVMLIVNTGVVVYLINNLGHAKTDGHALVVGEHPPPEKPAPVGKASA